MPAFSLHYSIYVWRACVGCVRTENFSNPNKNENEKKQQQQPPYMYSLFELVSILVHANDHFKGLPRMEALIRIANIPIVESGVKTAGNVYLNLKVCYNWMKWNADKTFTNAKEHSRFCFFASFSFVSNAMACFRGASIGPKVYFLRLSKRYSQQLKSSKAHCNASIKFYAIAWILLSNVYHPFICHRKWYVNTFEQQNVLISFRSFDLYLLVRFDKYNNNQD